MGERQALPLAIAGRPFGLERGQVALQLRGLRGKLGSSSLEFQNAGLHSLLIAFEPGAALVDFRPRVF